MVLLHRETPCTANLSLPYINPKPTSHQPSAYLTSMLSLAHINPKHTGQQPRHLFQTQAPHKPQSPLVTSPLTKGLKDTSVVLGLGAPSRIPQSKGQGLLSGSFKTVETHNAGCRAKHEAGQYIPKSEGGLVGILYPKRILSHLAGTLFNIPPGRLLKFTAREYL